MVKVKQTLMRSTRKTPQNKQAKQAPGALEHPDELTHSVSE